MRRMEIGPDGVVGPFLFVLETDARDGEGLGL
jgi:hypothetical protein